MDAFHQEGLASLQPGRGVGGLGLAGSAATDLLWAQVAGGVPITRETLAAAEALAGQAVGAKSRLRFRVCTW